MAKKVTIEGSNLLQNLNDDWGGVNNSQGSVTPYSGQGASTPVPAGAEWGMNRGEVERFIKSSINAQQSRVGYYVCDNAASATAKTVVALGYQLATGGCVRIKMTNTNTANNVTLNINSTGAKALYYDGVQASATNTWEAGEVLEVYYDGTQYQCSRSSEKKTINAVNRALIPVSGNVSIIGDSISTFAGTMPNGYVTYYPNETLGVTNLYDMWWQHILSLTNSKIGVNASWSGSRATKTAGNNVPDFYERANILGNPDYIFVELGVNDSYHNVELGDYDYESETLSETQFIPAYTKGIKALLANYPSAKIVLFIFQMADQYAAVIKNIGTHYGLPVIDVRSYYINNAHPSKDGMKTVAQSIVSYYVSRNGGGGKFATGEEIKDVSITDTVTENSTALLESGAVFSMKYDMEQAERTSPLINITYVQGSTYNNNGADAPDGNVIRTDYLDVSEISTVTFSSTLPSGYTMSIKPTWYNGSKVLLQTPSWSEHSNQSISVSVPSGAIYLRLVVAGYNNGTQITLTPASATTYSFVLRPFESGSRWYGLLEKCERLYEVDKYPQENSTNFVESDGLYQILYSGVNVEILGSELKPCNAIIRSSDNKWLSSSSTNNNAALIDVRPYINGLYSYSCSIIKGTENGFSYAFLTAGVTLNTVAQFATGYTASVHSDNDVTVAIPSDAVYLYVYLNSSNTYYTPNKVTFNIDSLYQRIVNCENLEFATGEKVKDTSISNEVKNNSDIVTGSSVFPIMAKINAAEGNLDVDIDTTFESGSTSPATGELVTDNYTIRTDYIDVSNISTLYADIPNLPNGYKYRVKPTFYNSSKALVETPQWTSQGTGEMAMGIPSGTTYVIVVFNAYNGSTRITLTPQNSYGSHVYVKADSPWNNLLEKANQVEGIENKINEAEAIPVPVADIYWEQGSTMNADGTNATDNNCIRSSYVNTSSLTRLYFSAGNVPDGYILKIKPTWYNSSKGLLETPVWSGDLLNKEIDVPTGAYYLRLVVAMYSVGGTQTTLTPALADTYSIRLSDSVSEWFGLLDKVNRLANNEVARKMAPTTMKVASYNIGHFSHGGKDSNITAAQYVEKLSGYKNLIYNELNADIIGVCEYSRIFGKNTDNIDVKAKEVLFYKYGFIFDDFEQRNYSCDAMFARQYFDNIRLHEFECNKTAVITHTNLIKATDYYYIEADLWMAGNKIALVMTHLAFDNNNPQVAADQIAELITKFANTDRVVLMGDWNVASFDQFTPFVTAGYTLGNDGTMMTYPDTNPNKALDNIIVKGMEISNVGIVQTSGLSDHLPLYATITLP